MAGHVERVEEMERLCVGHAFVVGANQEGVEELIGQFLLGIVIGAGNRVDTFLKEQLFVGLHRGQIARVVLPEGVTLGVVGTVADQHGEIAERLAHHGVALYTHGHPCRACCGLDNKCV